MRVIARLEVTLDSSSIDLQAQASDFVTHSLPHTLMVLHLFDSLDSIVGQVLGPARRVTPIVRAMLDRSALL